MNKAATQEKLFQLCTLEMGDGHKKTINANSTPIASSQVYFLFQKRAKQLIQSVELNWRKVNESLKHKKLMNQDGRNE